MRALLGTSAALGAVLLVLAGKTAPVHGALGGRGSAEGTAAIFASSQSSTSATASGGFSLHGVEAPDVPADELTAVVRQYCMGCHNDALLTGNLSLQSFDVAKAPEKAETAELMIGKLRAGMMPPPGMPRPSGDTLLALVETLEKTIDGAFARNPNPGNRPFQRLNRPEYQESIKELLDLDVDPGDYLPLDTKSANFDNIADVQVLSATLLDSYLKAAAEISRLAVGDPHALPGDKNYEKGGYNSQWDQVEGAPYGTRGGISVIHNFPADGEYVFKMAFDHTTTGGFQGRGVRFEKVEVSIDGEPVSLVDVDQWMTVADPNGVNQQTDSIFVRAGPHRVTAAFIDQFEGPIEDLTSPHDWSLADREIGSNGYTGITQLAHLKDLTISGPYNPTGVSETPSRRKIFSCRPTVPSEEASCARRILSELGAQAYRRALTDEDIEGLMAFFEQGSEDGGFEVGIRTGLQAILASPDFIFRFEPGQGRIDAGETYEIADEALASRLSFFLWGTPPDQELLDLAERGKLSEVKVLDEQTRRMLADPRAEALGSRFAAQWLRLQDLDKVHPDAYWFPDYDQQLADAMRRETELFFYNLVKEDRSLLELYGADYTFVNERLARHYGIPGVVGNEFRRVPYPDDKRKGIFGHGSILTLTSVANRTSPVLRGKWVMEVILGTPPPPPPPGVPDLEQTAGSTVGRQLTTRERMELHRKNPTCAACHQFMDPIGLALDNFDVTGKWRIRENGIPLDTRGTFYDGTPIENPEQLRNALLARPVVLVRNFTQNLMAYALGRRIEYYDKPAVRAIANEAAESDYRMSSFILGVVNSDAFRMKKADATAADQASEQR